MNDMNNIHGRNDQEWIINNEKYDRNINDMNDRNDRSDNDWILNNE